MSPQLFTKKKMVKFGQNAKIKIKIKNIYEVFVKD